MVTMAIYATTQESDGDWRSWETIRLHTRIFLLALSLIPIAGPLVVYLVEVVTRRSSTPSVKAFGR